MWNKELADELHKGIIRKFEKRKLSSSFIDYIWGDYLAAMKLISKFNKENTVPCTYVISDLNVEEIVGTFYVKESQKPNEKEF